MTETQNNYLIMKVMDDHPLEFHKDTETWDTRSTQFIIIIGLMLCIATVAILIITILWGIKTIPSKPETTSTSQTVLNQTPYPYINNTASTYSNGTENSTIETATIEINDTISTISTIKTNKINGT